MDLGKIPFSLQCLFMIFWFGYCFFFPIETGLWLVKDGFALITLEFLSVFMLVLIPAAFGKETGWKSSRGKFSMAFEGPKAAGRGNRADVLFAIILISLMAFLWTFLSDAIYLFGYFVVSSVIKAVLITKRKDALQEGKEAAIIGIAMLASALLAILVSPVFHLFPENLEILREAFVGKNASGLIVDNPGFMAAWGMLYFLLIMAFEIFEPIKIQKR